MAESELRKRYPPGPPPKPPEGLVPTALRIERDTLRQLQNAAQSASLRNVSDEIRKRLRWTFDLEPLGRATRELLKDVALIAAEIEAETGHSWNGHPGAYVAFQQALLSRLARDKPERGNLAFGSRPNRSTSTDDPQEIGVWAEYEVHLNRDLPPNLRADHRRGKEAVYRQILSLQEQNKGQS